MDDQGATRRMLEDPAYRLDGPAKPRRKTMARDYWREYATMSEPGGWGYCPDCGDEFYRPDCGRTCDPCSRVAYHTAKLNLARLEQVRRRDLYGSRIGTAYPEPVLKHRRKRGAAI